MDPTLTETPEAHGLRERASVGQPDPGRGIPLSGPQDHEHPPLLHRVDLVRIGLMVLACVASGLGLWRPFASFDVIALVATLAGGYPIFREALTNLLARRMTMELSMTIALVARSPSGSSSRRW